MSPMSYPISSSNLIAELRGPCGETASSIETIRHNGWVNVMARADVWNWLRQTGYFDDLMVSVLVVVLVRTKC
jgi:hypothetical protein